MFCGAVHSLPIRVCGAWMQVRRISCQTSTATTSQPLLTFSKVPSMLVDKQRRHKQRRHARSESPEHIPNEEIFARVDASSALQTQPRCRTHDQHCALYSTPTRPRVLCGCRRPGCWHVHCHSRRLGARRQVALPWPPAARSSVIAPVCCEHSLLLFPGDGRRSASIG